jgi:hypothetical protein
MSQFLSGQIDWNGAANGHDTSAKSLAVSARPRMVEGLDFGSLTAFA